MRDRVGSGRCSARSDWSQSRPVLNQTTPRPGLEDPKLGPMHIKTVTSDNSKDSK